LRRREFIAGLGSAVAAAVTGSERAALAQQSVRVRRIGLLLNTAADDPESQIRITIFAQRLGQLGWTIGRDLQIDYRWTLGEPERIRRDTTELVSLAPDVIVASGGVTVRPLLQLTHSLPIVFVTVTDPVGAGFVESLSHPGGNATGFTLFEYGIGGKWLGLLKQLAPNVTRAAVVYDPSTPAGGGQLGALQAVAPLLGTDLRPADVRDPVELERTLAAFARGANGGLIVTSNPLAATRRQSIIKLAAEFRLPAVYPTRFWVGDGGLSSYGPDNREHYRLAAGYVDRILKGEKPADLAVQAPTKFELLINLKTAKALGLTIPETLLATADEVIQ
jgi:putative tryptophan/tyrosine transport system substrate-binding protein